MLDITDDNRIASEVCEYTGIEEKPLWRDQHRNIVAYPNPASDVINISNCQGANMSLQNMVGQVHGTWENVQGSIDVSAVPEGMYLLQIDLGSDRIVRKVSVRR